MDFNFTIRFGNPNRPELRQAREYASKFRKFTPAREGAPFNLVETDNHEALEKLGALENLLETIRDWDSARVIQGVTELTPADFHLERKQEVLACHRKYLEADDQNTYCDDKSPDCWGCRLLKGAILRHEKSTYDKNARYWYQFGTFTDANTWRINKEALTASLEDIVQKKGIDFCPVFQYVFFRRYVAALPLMVHLAGNRDWELVYKEDSLDGAKRWHPFGISHRNPSDGAGEEGAQPGGPESESWLGLKKKTGSSSDAQNLRYVPETSFADIGGVDEIIQNIRIMIELPIVKPQLFAYLGVKPYRGVLLWGDPGNGKTLIARAIAHEVNAHFIPVAGPDILNKNFGQSEKNLRDIFEEARQFQPAVVFIDEIDSIAQTRLSGESAKWYATVVNQLMSLMDGIREYGNVTILATTNRPDLLDAALLRPGRFDYKLEIKKPNLPGCKRVLEIATRDMPLADDVDLFAFSEQVVGYSAAEITFLAKEAAMVALRKAVESKTVSYKDDPNEDYSFLRISMSDLKTALHLLKWNRRYVNLTYSLKDKKLT